MRNCFYNHRPTKSSRRYSPPPYHLPALFYHITNRDWPATLIRCQTHPHEASFTDRWENTALHLACRFGGRNAVPLNAIQLLLEISSSLAQNVDGCTPLHLACSHRSSADVISALLEASRRELSCGLDCSLSSSSSLSSSFRRPSKKWVEGGDTSELEDESLVDTHNFQKDEKRQKILKSNKSGATILTKSRKTPLHYACGSFRHLSLEAFRILLQATYEDSDSSDILLQEDDNGDTPLSLLQKRYSERIRQAIDLVQNRNGVTQNERERIDPVNNEVDDVPHNPERLLNASIIESTLGEFWEKANMIIQTSYRGTKHRSCQNQNQHNNNNNNSDHETHGPNKKRKTKQKRWRIVHATIGIGSKCPKPVLMLALSTYPEQVKECDEHGNFPLHIAAMRSDPTQLNSASFHSSTTEESITNTSSEREPITEIRFDVGRHTTSTEDQLENYCADFNLIETLIKIFPKAAQMPNKDGDLPFALAVHCGKWMWGKDLKTLLMAFPSAIECLDLKDEYYPYILCLIGNECCNHPQERSDERNHRGRSSSLNNTTRKNDWVSLFYTMVRERPLIVKYGSSENKSSDGSKVRNTQINHAEEYCHS